MGTCTTPQLGKGEKPCTPAVQCKAACGVNLVVMIPGWCDFDGIVDPSCFQHRQDRPILKQQKTGGLLPFEVVFSLSGVPRQRPGACAVLALGTVVGVPAYMHYSHTNTIAMHSLLSYVPLCSIAH